jgi:hypothetical protein
LAQGGDAPPLELAKDRTDQARQVHDWFNSRSCRVPAVDAQLT